MGRREVTPRGHKLHGQGRGQWGGTGFPPGTQGAAQTWERPKSLKAGQESEPFPTPSALLLSP